MPLDREEDWKLFFEGSSVRVRPGFGEGLDSIISPPLLGKSIIRILVQSKSAKRSWWWSGLLIQEIGSGMEFQRWRIPLDRKIILWVNLSQRYRLRFQPVKWLEDLNLKIDTYEGEKIELLQ
jgi:hypothetical protein